MLFDLSPSPSLRECKFRAFVWFKFKGTGNFFFKKLSDCCRWPEEFGALLCSIKAHTCIRRTWHTRAVSVFNIDIFL